MTILKLATTKELRRWENAAAKGEAKAQNQLACVALERHDYAKAEKWAQKSALQGYTAGETTLGILYLAGWGVPQNYAATLNWFHVAAAQGYAQADLELGILHQRGWGVPRDYAVATKWFRIAAGKGNPVAQFDLGRQYRNGLGVQQNYRKAVVWYRRAAMQGCAAGESGLGDMFEQGRGGPHDYAKALYWYRKAAARGNADAENGIGVLFTRALGVPQNYPLAMRYFKMAASGGYAVAMQNTGLLYAYGEGVPRNFPKAKAWLRRAVAAGDPGAGAYLSWIKRTEASNLLSWLALAVAITGTIWWLRRRIRRSSNGNHGDNRDLPYVARGKRWCDIWIGILMFCQLVAFRPMLSGHPAGGPPGSVAAGIVVRPLLVRIPLIGAIFLLVGLAAVVVLAVWSYKTSEALGARAPWLWALLIFVPVFNLLVLFRLRSKANKWLKA